MTEQVASRSKGVLVRALQEENVDSVMLLLGPQVVDAVRVELPCSLLLAKSGYLVRLLLDVGADPNARDHLGRRPLHVAASLNNTDVIDALVDGGAHVDERDEWHRTALETAIACYHFDAIMTLHLRGASWPGTATTATLKTCMTRLCEVNAKLREWQDVPLRLQQMIVALAREMVVSKHDDVPDV